MNIYLVTKVMGWFASSISFYLFLCVLVCLTVNVFSLKIHWLYSIYISVDQTSMADERVNKKKKLKTCWSQHHYQNTSSSSFFLYDLNNRYSLRIQLRQQTNMLAAIKMLRWLLFVLYFVAHFHYSLLDSSVLKHEKQNTNRFAGNYICSRAVKKKISNFDKDMQHQHEQHEEEICINFVKNKKGLRIRQVEQWLRRTEHYYGMHSVIQKTLSFIAYSLCALVFSAWANRQ